MRTIHKNKIFQILHQSNCGIGAFDLKEKTYPDGDNHTIIQVKNTKLNFSFISYPASYNHYKISVAKYSAEPFIQDFDFLQSLDKVIPYFEKWLKEDVKQCLEDMATIDLWDEYKNGVEYLKVDEPSTTDLTYFSSDDIIRMKFAIQDLKGLIEQKFDLTNDQLTMVNDKLDYLIGVAQRAPKTDWKGVAMSVISSIIIALSLDTARGNQLWELFMQVFRVISLLPSSTA